MSRAHVAPAAALVALLAAGATHLYEQQRADARVLDARAEDATHLAEVQEQSARQSIELQGELAESRLALEHSRAEVRQDVTLEGHIIEVSGATPVQPGGPNCRVELGWSHDPLDGCRALIRCGTVQVYGGPGSGYFDDCTVDERGIVRGQDPNPTSNGGDPRLTLIRADHTLTVSDDGPEWSLRIALQPIDEDLPNEGH